jgi:hypothetical protein
MQQVLGYSALETGIAQLPLAGTIVLAAGAVSPLVTRVGSKPVLLVGLGLAGTFIALTVTSIEGVPEQQYGLVSGLINTTQQTGGALGLAILTAVASGRTGDELARGAKPASPLPRASSPACSWPRPSWSARSCSSSPRPAARSRRHAAMQGPNPLRERPSRQRSPPKEGDIPVKMDHPSSPMDTGRPQRVTMGRCVATTPADDT